MLFLDDVTSLAGFYGCSVGTAMATALAVASAIVCKRVYAVERPKENTFPLSLFVINVAPSGAGQARQFDPFENLMLSHQASRMPTMDAEILASSPPLHQIGVALHPNEKRVHGTLLHFADGSSISSEFLRKHADLVSSIAKQNAFTNNHTGFETPSMPLGPAAALLNITPEDYLDLIEADPNREAIRQHLTNALIVSATPSINGTSGTTLQPPLLDALADLASTIANLPIRGNGYACLVHVDGKLLLKPMNPLTLEKKGIAKSEMGHYRDQTIKIASLIELIYTPRDRFASGHAIALKEPAIRSAMQVLDLLKLGAEVQMLKTTARSLSKDELALCRALFRNQEKTSNGVYLMADIHKIRPHVFKQDTEYLKSTLNALENRMLLKIYKENGSGKGSMARKTVTCIQPDYKAINRLLKLYESKPRRVILMGPTGISSHTLRC